MYTYKCKIWTLPWYTRISQHLLTSVYILKDLRILLTTRSLYNLYKIISVEIMASMSVDKSLKKSLCTFDENARSDDREKNEEFFSEKMFKGDDEEHRFRCEECGQMRTAANANNR